MAKKELELLPREKQIIIGSLLGDATAEQQGSGNVRLRFDHGKVNEELALWKYDQLKRLRTERPINYKNRFDRRTQKYYEHVCFDTRTLACLKWCRSAFYSKEGDIYRKIVPKDIVNEMGPLGLSVLYMDDGHLRTDCNAARICTHSFDKESLEILMETIFKITGAETTIHIANRDKDQNVIYIPSAECPKFFKVIRPFVAEVPSMLRKIVDYPV